MEKNRNKCINFLPRYKKKKNRICFRQNHYGWWQKGVFDSTILNVQRNELIHSSNHQHQLQKMCNCGMTEGPFITSFWNLIKVFEAKHYQDKLSDVLKEETAILDQRCFNKWPTTNPIQELIFSLGWKVLQHTVYSSDLAYYFFRSISSFLKYQRFTKVENLQK